jgi:hypothetical protein
MEYSGFNGWTNYATWRIALEIFEGWVLDEGEPIEPSEVKAIIEEVVFSDCTDYNKLCQDYAHAFIANVNFCEIAAHINEQSN